MNEPLTAPRALSVTFELPSSDEGPGEVTIEAPGLGQVAAALRLDPKKTTGALLESMAAQLRAAGYTVAAPEHPAAAQPLLETDRQRVERLLRQSKLLFGKEHAHLADKLKQNQVVFWVEALYLAAAGIDPTDTVKVQQYLAAQQEAGGREAEAVAADIDTLVINLAAKLKIPPSEAGKIPLADALALRAQMSEDQADADKFTAALAGVKL